MASESNSSSASASPSGKRGRDPEDELYIDNLHSHKRYLSEIMASSLNGLTVGEDPLRENLMDSPARSDHSMCFLRDEMGLQYSPMLEDIDDSQYFDNHLNNNCSPSQPESRPTSPVSPYRYQRPVPTSSYHSLSHAYNFSTGTCSPARPRGSDTEGRFPSSPSDICHSADLRRAALMRSVHFRTQEELVSNIDNEDGSFVCMKSAVDERDCRSDDCSSLHRVELECAFDGGKSRVDESSADERDAQIDSTVDKDKPDLVLNTKGELGLDDSENG